jgi:NADP-dependent 3-hydroxy acid dehydrogenase YdfG
MGAAHGTGDVETGRVVWITGAGSGMGRAAAIAAAARGWRVALTGRRREALEKAARQVADGGGEALVVPGDVRDHDQVEQAAASIEQRWGRLDGLVLAAGLNTPHRAWRDQRLEDFRAVVDTNLVAAAHVVDAGLAALRTSRGTVVVISSYSAWRFSPGAGVAYSASKAALASLCQTLNAEEADRGVRSCHLCPGDVDTDFLFQRPNVPDADARSVMLSAQDVARAVLFVLDAPPHVRIDELVISPVAQR